MIGQQGHKEQSIRLHRNIPADCQQMLFSATYDAEVMEFAETLIPEPVIFRLRREEQTVESIRQYWVQCRTLDDKYESLANLYGVLTIGQCMIFTRTRKAAAWLAGRLSADRHQVALLSGELSIEQRGDVIRRFKEGKEKVLISTNVTARGIDVEQVTIVVNFDLPVTIHGQPDFETYLHRIGRTGRFGKSGIAVNFVSGDHDLVILQQIEAYFGKKIDKLDAGDVDALEKINSY